MACMHSLRSIALGDWTWDDEDQSGGQCRARDLNAELLKVPVVVGLRGGRPPPGLRSMLESLYKILSLKPSHKLITKPVPDASSTREVA